MYIALKQKMSVIEVLLIFSGIIRWLKEILEIIFETVNILFKSLKASKIKLKERLSF